MSKKKIISCEDLQSSLYFAPNVLRHCCQRFFVKGQLKGDVEIYKVKDTADIQADKIIKEKKKIIQNLNNGTPTPCDGCPKLLKKVWENNIKIKKISMEAHSKCNARCSYCSEMFYGGLNPNYDVQETFENLKNSNLFSEKVSIAWGGGEPVLLKNFDKIFLNFMESKNPRFDDVRVYSNSIIFNENIYEYLKKKRIILTTSIDAGSQKVFETVRGVKKGFLKIFENLQKYNTPRSNNIIIKYIITDENFSITEINKFIELIKIYNLENCNFEISTDYKNENLELEKVLSIIHFYNKLKKSNDDFVHFDDHVRKRIFEVLKKTYTKKDIIKNKIFKDLVSYFNEEIIVWGTGRYAFEIINKSFLFKNANVLFYVDRNGKFKENSFIDKDVKSPNEILKYNNPILIASSTYWNEIYSKLLSMGVSKSRIINTLVI